MDIATQSEILLREGGYETWQTDIGARTITCFESQAIAGFLHVFDTCSALISDWRSAQQLSLNRYASALRPAGVKAWNIYSVFLSPEAGTALQDFEVERIEEDFTLTRKIARGRIAMAADVSAALLPLLPLSKSSSIVTKDYQSQLRKHLGEFDERITASFLGNLSTAELAAILVDLS